MDEAIVGVLLVLTVIHFVVITVSIVEARIALRILQRRLHAHTEQEKPPVGTEVKL